MIQQPPDLLATLAPPIRLVDWFDKVLDDKARKGEPVPPEFIAWLETWKRIRAAGTSPIDGAPESAWAKLAERVNR